MQRIIAILFVTLMILMTASAIAAPDAEKDIAKGNDRFAVYYSDKAPTKEFKSFQLVVLDATHHPDLLPLKEEGKTLLGYISLGEVRKTDPLFATLSARHLILQENPNWKDSFYVDVRDPFWAKTVLEDIVPSVLRQGFDGLFLDTLDDPIALEDKDHGKYPGMNDAAVHLVQAIRMHYPSIKIMMNRGYGILPKVAASVDYELGESVYAGYNFEKKAYAKVTADTYQQQLKILQDAKDKNANLKVYTLDYSDPADDDAIKEIYKTEHANGFTPYVATIGLDRVIPEPETR